MLQMRDYQHCAFRAVTTALLRLPSALVISPTGTGKTVLFAHLAQAYSQRGVRVLILAHLEELVFQAAEKVKMVTGLDPELEMAEHTCKASTDRDSNIVIASVQSLSRPERLLRFRPEEFALIIIDEAQHAVATNKSYARIVQHFQRNQHLKVLGVTATPERLDKVALSMFSSVVFQYEIAAAINDGYLTPIEQYAITVEHLDLTRVRTSENGDFRDDDLARVLAQDRVIVEIATATFTASNGRPTLVFAPPRAKGESGDSPAMRIVAVLNSLRTGCAAVVAGDTPRDLRRELVARFKDGRLQFLVSCSIFLEGFDAPNAAVIAMARPTLSRSLYAQAMGRGTRPLPGVVDGLPTAAQRRAAIAASAKPAMLVLDFVGNSRHKLVTAADLLGDGFSDEVVARVKSLAGKASGPIDVIESLRDAEHAIRAEQDAERAKSLIPCQVQATVRYTATPVDPFGANNNRLPSNAQRRILANNGLPVPASYEEAYRLVGDVVHRSSAGLCSYRQARVLERCGYSNAMNLSFDEASRLIGEMAANGWRRERATI